MKSNNIFEKKINFSEIVFLAVVLLFSVNVDNRYFYFICIATILYFMIKPGVVRVNSSLMALFVLAFSMIVFDPQYLYSILGILKPVVYPLAYILGYNYIKNSEKKETALYRILFVLVGGMFIHLCLNLQLNINATDRNITDVWTNEISSATLQAAVGLWPMAAFVALLFTNVKGQHKLIALAGLITILYYNIILAGRTLFVILAVLIVMSILYMLISSDYKNKFRNVLIIAGIFVVILTMFNRNTFGIKGVVYNSNFYERFYGERSNIDIDEDGRLEKKALYIKNMIDYPFGGDRLRQFLDGQSAHDLCLDAYNEAGIFALLALIVVIVNSIKKLWMIMTSKKCSYNLRLILLCIYVISYIEFFMEPILRGIPWFFVSFILMEGVVQAYIDKGEKFA